MSAIAPVFAPDSVIAGVWAAVGSLRPVAVPALDDDAVVRLLIEVEAVGRRLDAVRATLAGEAAERSRRELGRAGLAQRRGCRTAVELVQRTTGASAATVNRRIRVGLATRASTTLTGAAMPPRFETVAAALDAGTLPYDSACAIVDVLSPALRVATAHDVGVAEAEVVAGAAAPDALGAAAMDADSVRLQATVWHAVLDPDGAEPDERDLERRCLRLLGVRHGLVPVTGMLLPEVAASLRQYADACTSLRSAELPTTPARDGEHRTSPARDGEHPRTPAPGDELSDPPGDQRSRAQQLHDVLATIIGVAARAADAPSVAGNAPTLVVSVRAEDLAAGRGSAFVEGLAAPVGIAVARQVGCGGAVQSLILGGSGRVVGLQAPQRCFTGVQRRAIALRDGGCVIPGCHVPTGWCEVHHVTPHAHDPDGTHTNNGVLLCWFHHRTIDTSGWEIRMQDGVPEVKAPSWLDRGGGWRPAVGSPARITEGLARFGDGRREPEGRCS